MTTSNFPRSVGRSTQFTMRASMSVPVASATLHEREARRVLVVVGRGDVRTADHRPHRHEAESAPQLEHALAAQSHDGELLGEDARGRPEVGPVGEALVPDEVVLADQVVGVRRHEEADRSTRQLDLAGRRAEAAHELLAKRRDVGAHAHAGNSALAP